VSTRQLIFLGATAFPEIAEIARDVNRARPTYDLAGILDDNGQLHGTSVEGCPVLGPLEAVHDYPDALFVLGIGSYRTRLLRHEIIGRLGLPPERFETLLHPAAKVYASSSVGRGSILHAGAVVFNDTIVEDFVVVYPNSVIGARNRLCRHALITSLVTTTMDVMIGSCVHIGTASAIGEGVKIGPGARIAMGTTVLRDVPAGVFCMGNPPRFLARDEVPEDLLERWETLTGEARSS
jgi:sugar O-acyltransferase (sialic acid O-acetyltransferase NeuD family)